MGSNSKGKSISFFYLFIYLYIGDIMFIQEKDVKSILSKSNLPIAGYTANPYVGCPHACKYCYADFMKRFTGHKEKWGTFLDVK